MAKQFKPKTCPVCGKTYDYKLAVHYEGGEEWCEHDNIAAADSRVPQRRLNEEASNYALKMAAEQRRADHEMGLDQRVIVNPPPGTRGHSFSIPKSVVEGIKEKVTPELEPLLD